LCEKPFTVNAAEARKVVATAKKKNLPVAEAFMYRHHPVYDRVRELIGQGTIGDVITLRSIFSFPLHDPDNIRLNPDLAGGALMDVGCYCVNFSRMMAGCEPKYASAFVRQAEVDKTVIACLEFPNNLLAYFECSFETHSRSRAVIKGTDGTIILPSPWFPGEDRAEIILRRGTEEKREHVNGADTYQLEVEDFVNACRTHQRPRWPAEDAIANMAVIDAIYRSAKERSPVKVAKT
jgi:predicted dehydrogenase